MIRRLNKSCLTRAGMFALMAVLTCLLLFQLIPSSHPSEIVVQQEGESSYTQVYLKEEEGLIVPLSIETGEAKDSAERIQFMSGVLAGKQPIEGFSGILCRGRDPEYGQHPGWDRHAGFPCRIL